jgi:hypothetical protein
MPLRLPALVCLGAVCFYCAQTLGQATPSTADAIMARVAANQDRSETERAHYVYVQHAHMVSRRGTTVMCEETTDSRVTPSEAGSHRELLKLDGRLLVKRGYVTYNTLAKDKTGSNVKNEAGSISITVGDEGADRDLVENMRGNLIEDKSRDGINDKLFPLSSKELPQYDFVLAGRERMNGRDTFHVIFRPKDKTEFGWKGDAYIDSGDFQPVLVRTNMAKKIPLAVRTLLGTNVPGLGFSIVYAPQPDGVWLPVSFGTEFKMHVLFFFRREIVLDAENRNFEKTHVASKIVAVGEAAAH